MLYINPKHPPVVQSKHKITDNHNIAICNDTTTDMVPLSPAEPPVFNTFETIARLSLSQNQRDLSYDTQTHAISNTSIITTNNIGNTPKK